VARTSRGGPVCRGTVRVSVPWQGERRMTVDPATANQLAQIGREVGANVLEGALRTHRKQVAGS
jgi:hypothetical protein